VSEKEIGDPDFEGAQAASSSLAQSFALNGNRGQEMIEGVDPNMHETPSSGQEMQERSSMRMLAAKPRGGAENAKPIDLMDLDQVMEDDNVAQESGAVMQIGLMD
jgi:hypothetical protein